MTADLSDIHHADYEKEACIIFCVIVPFFVFVRFWSRILAKQLGSDDWAALISLFTALCSNIQTLVAISYGWGRHKQNLNKEQLRIVLILHWTFQITYKLTVAFNKVSILLLYLRIMPQRAYRMTIYGLLITVGLFSFSTSIAGILQCVPVAKAWQKNMPGYCYDLVKAWYANAIFSIITDIAILCLPMHMVYKLQRSRREKFLLYGIFGIGAFVTFTSIMRMFALKSAKNPDVTYDVNSGFWSVIETNVGVICICLPPLRSLITKYVPNFGTTRSGRSGGSKSSYPPPSYSNSTPVQNTIGGGPIEGSWGTARVRGSAGDSEEELVADLEGNLSDRGGIRKTMEVHLTTGGVEDAGEIELGHWSKSDVSKQH
ncbi:hypothetical protein BP5796_06162 [Coleophoma crateriformis]|uniref:Rhodopsin domain-containing protein n=1 Tax=Coleophoma crateriformis TaxID=565419 RepID=A0A3D8RWK5_9HELO|nr:hypothetical protein BP5796_06162 [Coleophoma crateriformis]